MRNNPTPAPPGAATPLQQSSSKGARKVLRARSQPTTPAASTKKSAATSKTREQLELPEGLHRRLTREAIGEGGSVESFVMLLLVVDAAIKAGDLLTAQNLLFRSVTHAYENSNHYVTALMEFHDRMKLQAAALLTAEGEGGLRP